MAGHLASLSSHPRYKAVWLIFFMLGLGTLLPWNFFMTATKVRLGELGSMGGRVPWAYRAWVCVFGHRKREVSTLYLQPLQYFTNRLDMSQNVSLVTAERSKDIQDPAAPTAPSPEQRSLSAIFNNVMTLCAMLPLLLFTCLNSFLHQK